MHYYPEPLFWLVIVAAAALVTGYMLAIAHYGAK
jgi:hypothetical protein